MIIMLVKNEHYKELSVIPGLLHQEMYNDAIAVCMVTANKISECYLTWHLLGLLCLYKINTVDINNGEYNKQIINSFMRSVKIQPRRIPYLDERDICVEYLRLYQKYKRKISVDINKLLSIKYNDYKNKILSRIYSSISRMQYVNKNIDVNIDEANKALLLDDQNPGVYPLLYGIYHEIMKDNDKLIDITNKWMNLKNTNYAQSIMPCMALSELYAKSGELKKAGYYALVGLRRNVNYLRNTGSEDYKIPVEYIVNGNVRIRKVFPAGVPQYLLDPRVNGERAHYWAALSYWKDGDYRRSSRHLVASIESKHPEKDRTYKQKLRLMLDNPVGLIMRIQDVDYYINKIVDSNVQNLDDLYQHVYYLEKVIKGRINEDYYKCLTKYINMSSIYTPLAVVIPKRIYSAVLYAALQKYHCSIWPIYDYLNEIIIRIMEDTKKETLYDNMFNSILMRLNIDEYIIKYIRNMTDPLINTNEEDRLSKQYKEICNLMRSILNKLGFTHSIKSVDKLEKFINILRIKNSDKASSMINELIEAFNGIGNKLSTCNENITILTSNDNLSINNKDINEDTLSWFRETIIESCVVYTHESGNPQKYENKYDKGKNKYRIFIDERYSVIRVKKRNRILNFIPKNVFIELLIKNYKLVTYSELLKYSKVIKEEKGRELVSGWIYEINNSAKWKEGEVIINKPNEGYLIKKGITYCVIYNPKINRIPKKDNKS